MKNKVINIEYTITSKEKNHICKENIKEDKITKIKDFKNNLLKSIIISNLEKPLSFHIIFIWQTTKLNGILQKLHEEKFPSNEKYLQNISDIKITFYNTINLQNMSFCYKLVNLINQKKNNTFEKYVIFTSKFQINLVIKCE